MVFVNTPYAYNEEREIDALMASLERVSRFFGPA